MEFVNSLPETERRSLGATLGDVDPEGMPVGIFTDIKCFLIYLPLLTLLAVHLLEKMLDIDPQKRIAAADALTHTYLSTYSDSDDEPECEKQIDWSSLDSEMSTEEWKTKMYVSFQSAAYWFGLIFLRYFEILNYHTGSYNWEDTNPKAHEGRFENWMRKEITVGTY